MCLFKKIYQLPLIIFSFFYFNSLEAQTALDKKEIFNNWVSTEGVLSLSKHDGLNKFIRFDTSLNNRICNTLDRLQKSKIDTLGFFVSSYPGSISKDTCKLGFYPSDIYIFWQSEGKCYLERLTNKCGYGFKRIDSLAGIFRYYRENLAKINAEYIMPVIYKGEINSKGNFTYSGSINSHEQSFIIFCQLKNNIKFLSFSSDAWTNKENIFYNDNLKSKSYAWFVKISSLFSISSN